jgi:hypothetical protein
MWGHHGRGWRHERLERLQPDRVEELLLDGGQAEETGLIRSPQDPGRGGE